MPADITSKKCFQVGLLNIPKVKLSSFFYISRFTKKTLAFLVEVWCSVYLTLNDHLGCMVMVEVVRNAFKQVFYKNRLI